MTTPYTKDNRDEPIRGERRTIATKQDERKKDERKKEGRGLRPRPFFDLIRLAPKAIGGGGVMG
jgi:hypothetical protein